MTDAGAAHTTGGELKKPQPDWFARFAAGTSALCGSRWAFIAAIIVVVVWGCLGPLYHFSDTWQLVINTGTTIITFLMVFLIQNTQNRDARAINLKLNEVIRALGKADNAVIDVEKLSDEQLDELTAQYEKIREKCVQERRSREQRQPSSHGEFATKIAGDVKSQVKGEVKEELKTELANDFKRVFKEKGAEQRDSRNEERENSAA